MTFPAIPTISTFHLKAETFFPIFASPLLHSQQLFHRSPSMLRKQRRVAAGKMHASFQSGINKKKNDRSSAWMKIFCITFFFSILNYINFGHCILNFSLNKRYDFFFCCKEIEIPLWTESSRSRWWWRRAKKIQQNTYLLLLFSH